LLETTDVQKSSEVLPAGRYIVPSNTPTTAMPVLNLPVPQEPAAKNV
jgi:hypothetical protein